MAVSVDMTVQEAVRGSEARARVMDKYGIDTCCGGKVPLRLACERRGLDPDQVLKELDAADDPKTATPAADLSALSLSALTDHLVETHHRFLRDNLPRLVELSRKVARVHGPQRPELVQLADDVFRFSEEMLSHLEKEEHVLFPFIRQMETAPASLSMPPNFVSHPIRVMLGDHETATHDLQEMRILTGGYRIPDAACGSYRALYDGLAALDADTMTHMQKENELLFPRAIAMAESISAG